MSDQNSLASLDNCEHLLQTANLEILEAESLIEKSVVSNDDTNILVDIDKNIERLEISQQQISDALKVFKHLKSGEDLSSSDAVRNVNLFQNSFDSSRVSSTRSYDDDDELLHSSSNNDSDHSKLDSYDDGDQGETVIM